ncbi:DNA polymerase III subunit theta [Pantoea agglomerans]|uniref:DNA polymerase III subunit theta n=1 Tax=Enterobacter agglomerans TaxID=549 RepID=UPI001CC9A8BB|nr:DNA polymerase III subunit theta [Pantoea agglomerans]UBN56368.1 DNA polymerase III subunit theta [Pantoea agglomerans]
MKFHIDFANKEERDRINVELAASGIAYKERINMPVIAYEVEMQQPEPLRAYFQERLKFYREESTKFPRGTDPVYQKELKD